MPWPQFTTAEATLFNLRRTTKPPDLPSFLSDDARACLRTCLHTCRQTISTHLFTHGRCTCRRTCMRTYLHTCVCTSLILPRTNTLRQNHFFHRALGLGLPEEVLHPEGHNYIGHKYIGDNYIGHSLASAVARARTS